MDKKQKTNIKKIIALGLTAALVLLLAFMPVIAAGKEEAEGPQASLMSTEASYANIESQLIGGGTLQSQNSVKVELPVNVKITSYLVGNGDTVKKGQIIAKVDKVSVMTAITEIQETLDYLDDEINDVSAEPSYETISSPVQGTVKQIFAAKGDNVQDVMLEHGALATMSLDGLMAVEFEAESQLKIGHKLTVLFADERTVEGRVTALSSNSVILTFEDDDYKVGEEVTLLDSDSNIVGSGEIYIYSPWNITAYTGKISSINISVGSNVYVGKALFTLSELGRDASYQQLIDQRRDYEELIQELFTMYKTGSITAPCDGIITGVDEDASYILEETGLSANFLGALKTNKVLKASSLSNSQNKGKFILLGDETTPEPTATPEPTSPPEPTATPEPTASPEPTPTPTVPPESTVSYEMRPAQIIDIGEGSAKVKESQTAVAVDDPNAPTQITINPEELTNEIVYNSNFFSPSNFAIGDFVLMVFDQDGNIVNVVKATSVSGGNPGGYNPGGSIPSGGSFPSGSGPFGGNSFGGGMTGGYSQTPVFEPYSLEKNVIASVISQEQMTLSFTVDEYDITKVYVGQQLTVTVDAIAGEKFEGSVSSISNSGENEGGNSKFTVEATLPVSSDMLPGMTAHAFITLDTAVNALCIPVAALTLDSGKNIVYTGFDEKHGELISPVSVTLGVADADNVEILTGLEAGTVVYYYYYE